MFVVKGSHTDRLIESLIGSELAQKQALTEGANAHISNLGISIPTKHFHKVWQIILSKQTSSRSRGHL